MNTGQANATKNTPVTQNELTHTPVNSGGLDHLPVYPNEFNALISQGVIPRISDMTFPMTSPGVMNWTPANLLPAHPLQANTTTSLEQPVQASRKRTIDDVTSDTHTQQAKRAYTPPVINHYPPLLSAPLSNHPHPINPYPLPVTPPLQYGFNPNSPFQLIWIPVSAAAGNNHHGMSSSAADSTVNDPLTSNNGLTNNSTFTTAVSENKPETHPPTSVTHPSALIQNLSSKVNPTNTGLENTLLENSGELASEWQQDPFSPNEAMLAAHDSLVEDDYDAGILEALTPPRPISAVFDDDDWLNALAALYNKPE